MQDLEAGSDKASERSFLLPSRRTSSLEDEMPPLSISRAHSRPAPPRAASSSNPSRTPASPSKPKGSLQVSADASHKPAEDQQSLQSKRMKGLGLAGVATVFQAVMSVCAKILGELHRML